MQDSTGFAPDSAPGNDAPQSSEIVDDSTTVADDAATGATDTTGNNAEETDEQRNERTTRETQERQKKRNESYQRRMNELTADKYAERTRAERAERTAEEYRQRVEGQQARSDPAQGDPEPTRENFTDYETFLRKVTQWEARKVARESTAATQRLIQQRDEQATVMQQAERMEQSFRQRHDAEAKTIPNYAKVIADSDGKVDILPNVAFAIAQSETPAQVMYYLAQHPEAADRMNGMAPLAIAREMGRLEATLKAPTQLSSAPTPGKPVGNKGVPNGDPPEDTDAYFKWADKHLK